MKLISASFVYTCNDEFEIINDGAVVFDKNIIEVGKKEELIKKYKQIEHIEYQNCIITPALINPHVHIEFSANNGILEYGSFMGWLKSVIKNREKLFFDCKKECLENAIKEILKSGVAIIGAISSTGSDLEVLANSRLKTIYFIEAIGSNPAALDVLWSDFWVRFESAKRFESSKFTPSIAIHSPYSVHPFFIKKILEKIDKKLILSAHFLESLSELRWLEDKEGEFFEFMSNFLPNPKPFHTPLEFLELFDGFKLILTHCTHASNEMLKYIKEKGYTIIHAPRSNRLLDGKRFSLKSAINLDINVALATDGLSSNFSLNLLDEAKYALFMHEEFDINELAKILLLSMTKNGARALNINSGELKKEKSADIAVFEVKEFKANPLLSCLLYTNKAKALFIDGELVYN